MLQSRFLPAAQSDLVDPWPCYQYMYMWSFINYIALQSREIMYWVVSVHRSDWLIPAEQQTAKNIYLSKVFVCVTVIKPGM